jgi:hypothetical protein
MADEVPQKIDPFTEEEKEKIILAFARGCLPQPVQADKLAMFVAWCAQARCGAMALELIISGRLLVTDIDPSEGPSFVAATVKSKDTVML